MPIRQGQRLECWPLPAAIIAVTRTLDYIAMIFSDISPCPAVVMYEPGEIRAAAAHLAALAAGR
jgi:hypothetical protein